MKTAGWMRRGAFAALTVFAVCAAALFAGCAKGEAARGPASLSVLVYITGMRAGSPPYDLMAQGAEEFAAERPGVTVKIYEAGFNQAEWEEQLATLVASGEYDVVLGSNPSLPEICASVGRQFPNQKFLITDAELSGNAQIATWLYNQYEQSLFLGYLAGLITTANPAALSRVNAGRTNAGRVNAGRANAAKKIGFIAAQEYPLLNRHIVPGFLAGAQMVDPAITLDTRYIGNWFDANKAAELAGSMIDAGADVFASIAGSAAQGMIRTARERGAYVVYHNTNEYAAAPGVIVGCGIMEQKKLVKEILAAALDGSVQYGEARTVGVREGYLGFIADDPGYTDYVPADLRARFEAFLADLKAGRVSYTLPPL